MNNPKIKNEFLEQVLNVRVHRADDLGTALKKPLLMLLVFSDIENHLLNENRIVFEKIEKRLSNLILLFGNRKVRSAAPEQPFFHLQSSDFWKFSSEKEIIVQPSRTPTARQLRDAGAYAELPDHIFKLIKHSQEVRSEICESILDKWWPETIHEDIRQALGLNYRSFTIKKVRDPDFARKILSNYRNQCAFCGFNASLNGIIFGLDAAHIKWHSANGPDIDTNGIALCKLHHWSLDRGVTTITKDYKIKVSNAFVAQDDKSIVLIEELENQEIFSPRGDDKIPDLGFLTWHNENVFVSN